jgi:hypothetical protein
MSYVKRPIGYVKQPMGYVKQPLRSVKQPLMTYAKQPYAIHCFHDLFDLTEREPWCTVVHHHLQLNARNGHAFDSCKFGVARVSAFSNYHLSFKTHAESDVWHACFSALIRQQYAIRKGKFRSIVRIHQRVTGSARSCLEK